VGRKNTAVYIVINAANVSEEKINNGDGAVKGMGVV
jgi:hypothetical protein